MRVASFSLLFLLISVLIIAAPQVSATEIREAEPMGLAPPVSSPEVIDTGLGEDGKPYLADTASFGSEARSDWLLGKVEPAVEAMAESMEMIDVIIYLSAPSNLPGQVSTVEEIKARYRPVLDGLSFQIRDVLSANRPDFPMTEELEKYWVSFGPQLTEEQESQLDAYRLELDRTKDAMRREISVAIEQRAELSFSSIRDFITTGGGRVNNETALTIALGATIPRHQITVLAERSDVLTVMLDRPLELELDISVPSLRVDAWWTAGFDGGIWDGGVVDTGVQENHPAFSTINFFTDSATPTDTDGHGTHVAGIIASANATYSGAAPGLDALVWGRAGGQSTTMARMETMASALGQSPEVINHSLGYGTANVSDYNANDTFYDAFIQTYDILVSKSAGNSGWGSTTPTITHPAPAYNLLAVANMNDRATTDRSDDVRSSSSSTGPTVNGRRKPDIAAPGSVIRSTNAFWVGAGSGTNRGCRNSAVLWDYVDCSGTSMAAPHVAGMIVLMEDGGNNNPISQKAVLLNTADAWDSNDTSTTADDGPVTGSFWDKSYGWGYLDGWESEFNRSDVFVTTLVPRNDNNTEDDYKLYVGQMFAGEKATMVWEKRGVYAAGLPATTTYTLADLNLRLYNEVTGVLVGVESQGSENVHQVAANGTITAVIKPYSWSTSFSGGVSSESIALATEEDFVPVDFPTTFQGIAIWPTTVQPNEEFTYTGWIRNDSVLATHDNEIEIQLPAGWSIVSGANPQNIGSIPGGSTSAVTHGVWTLRAQSTPQAAVPVPFTHVHDSYAEDYGPFNWNLSINVVQDVTSPTPNPSTWGSIPIGTSSSQISMIATTSTDDHGPVEYYFDFTSAPMGGGGGSDSGWTTSSSYTDSGLDVNDSYCYRVKTRDNPTTTPNETTYSSIICRFSLANPPGAGSVAAVGNNTLRASWTGNGNPAGNFYFVENVTTGEVSGWIPGLFWDDTGLGCGTFTYRVKTRNANGIETAWTNLGSGSAIIPGLILCDGFESGDTSGWTDTVP